MVFDATLVVRGYPVSQILSDEHHYTNFLCGTCKKLVSLDSVVTVQCHHASCRKCIENASMEAFVRQKPCQCPTCNTELHPSSSSSPADCMQFGPVRVAARPLQEAEPLAYQVLRNVQVSCPFGVRCNWKGHYGDYLQHAISHASSDQAPKAPMTAVPVNDIDRRSVPVKELRHFMHDMPTEDVSDGKKKALATEEHNLSAATAVPVPVNETDRRATPLEEPRPSVNDKPADDDDSKDKPDTAVAVVVQELRPSMEETEEVQQQMCAINNHVGAEKERQQRLQAIEQNQHDRQCETLSTAKHNASIQIPNVVQKEDPRVSDIRSFRKKREHRQLDLTLSHGSVEASSSFDEPQSRQVQEPQRSSCQKGTSSSKQKLSSANSDSDSGDKQWCAAVDDSAEVSEGYDDRIGEKQQSPGDNTRTDSFSNSDHQHFVNDEIAADQHLLNLPVGQQRTDSIERLVQEQQHAPPADLPREDSKKAETEPTNQHRLGLGNVTLVAEQRLFPASGHPHDSLEDEEEALEVLLMDRHCSERTDAEAVYSESSCNHLPVIVKGAAGCQSEESQSSVVNVGDRPVSPQMDDSQDNDRLEKNVPESLPNGPTEGPNNLQQTIVAKPVENPTSEPPPSGTNDESDCCPETLVAGTEDPAPESPLYGFEDKDEDRGVEDEQQESVNVSMELELDPENIVDIQRDDVPMQLHEEEFSSGFSDDESIECFEAELINSRQEEHALLEEDDDGGNGDTCGDESICQQRQMNASIDSLAFSEGELNTPFDGDYEVEEESEEEEYEEAGGADEHYAHLVQSTEKLKRQANAKFNHKDFHGARRSYSKGIEALEDSEIILQSTEHKLLAGLYANRAVTFFQEKLFEQSIRDCERALKYDQSEDKAWIRKWRAMMSLGKFKDAFAFIQQAMEAVPDSKKIQREYERSKMELSAHTKAMALMRKGDIKQAQKALEMCIESTENNLLMVLSAQVDTALGNFDSAYEKIDRSLRINPNFADALELRGFLFFVQGETEKAAKMLSESFSLDKENLQMKAVLRRVERTHTALSDARSAVELGKYSEAAEKFATAIKESNPLPPVAPLFAILRTERAECNLLALQFVPALKDCHEVTSVCPTHAPAWIVRANVLVALGRKKDAKKELEKVRRLVGVDNPIIEESFKKLDFELRLEKVDADLLTFQKELEAGICDRLPKCEQSSNSMSSEHTGRNGSSRSRRKMERGLSRYNSVSHFDSHVDSRDPGTKEKPSPRRKSEDWSSSIFAGSSLFERDSASDVGVATTTIGERGAGNDDHNGDDRRDRADRDRRHRDNQGRRDDRERRNRGDIERRRQVDRGHLSSAPRRSSGIRPRRGSTTRMEESSHSLKSSRKDVTDHTTSDSKSDRREGDRRSSTKDQPSSRTKRSSKMEGLQERRRDGDRRSSSTRDDNIGKRDRPKSHRRASTNGGGETLSTDRDAGGYPGEQQQQRRSSTFA